MFLFRKLFVSFSFYFFFILMFALIFILFLGRERLKLDGREVERTWEEFGEEKTIKIY